jgi:zinc protease
MRRLTVVPILMLAGALACFAQGTPDSNTVLNPETPLPFDPSVVRGKLDNGLVYYIRHNAKPEKRAELRLVVNAGSVLEDDDQRGLAHFTEHMAFNGTENFKKQELVNYLESIGMRFGPDVNAYTSFDETVYMLQLPTDSMHIIERGFDILEDWAHRVSFDGDEIDKERGVIIEEWRLGRGADARMRDKQFPILFKNSRYAKRLPIGEKATLERFTHEQLRRFYRDWYRPDLMAVIAVGDFDAVTIEMLIRKHFALIPARVTERPRALFPVPDNPGTLYAIASDPEATMTSIGLFFKSDVLPEVTIRDYRRRLLEGLFNGMLNNRLGELAQQADPPFLYAFSGKGRLIRTREVYNLSAGVKQGGTKRGLETLLMEARRVRTFGFTQTEFERMKKDMLRLMNQIYEEREKTESANFADEYVRNFLVGEPAPGIAYEYAVYQQYLPAVTLEEVNALAVQWITENNRVVMLGAPGKAGVHVPTAKDLGTIISAATRMAVTPYVDKVTELPLVATLPTPGTIIARTQDTVLGTTEWTLSNGMRVILKPTDFKNDEILFNAFAPGGTSLASDPDYWSASMATSIVVESGIGAFDRIALQKRLSGKIANVMPSMQELFQGIVGNTTPQDLKTFFELLYLYFTAPRIDSIAFLSLKTRMQGFLENRTARPESAFEDTVRAVMMQHHFRSRPFTKETLDEIDLGKAVEFYRNRFSDAGGFTAIIVGSCAPNDIERLIVQYLAGLPGHSAHETWRDLGIRFPSGIIEKEIRKGIEAKSQVRVGFTGPFQWTDSTRYALSSLTYLMRMKMRENLREDKGGTYGVGVWGTPVRWPVGQYTAGLTFGCSPNRVEELTQVAFSVIDSLRRYGPDLSYIAKIQETQRREHETELKQNRSWLNWLQYYYSNNEDPRMILQSDQVIGTLSVDMMQRAANTYLNPERYFRAVLYPKGE